LSARARPSQGRTEIENLLSYRLTVVAALLSRSQLARFQAVSGISLAEWRTLVLVSNFGPLTVKDLSRRAGLDFGQTSRLVSRMSDSGLVEKERAEDARSVILSLSAAGRALQRDLWNLAMRCNDEFLGTLSDTDRRGLMNSLETLAATARRSLVSAGKRKRAGRAKAGHNR
jgi:DNA-binding MarR family transcriptional regulator